MRDIPDGVDEAELFSCLADGWGFEVASGSYLPVGGGSYHWVVADREGTRRFVTVDDLDDKEGSEFNRDAAWRILLLAFDTALGLRRHGGLDFVVASIPARTGATLRRLGSRHSVAVFPFIDGPAGAFGPYPTVQDRAEVIDLLVALHHATPAVAAEARRIELALPGRRHLEDALGDVDREWRGGPFSEAARQLVATHANHINGLLENFDRLGEQVRATSTAWVVTHGEPHPANVIRTPGGLKLIDWDTVQLAPAERDLWMVADPDGQELERYSRATCRSVNPAGLALFRLWWDLADMAIFVYQFRRPHRAGLDMTHARDALNRSLQRPGSTGPAPHVIDNGPPVADR